MFKLFRRFNLRDILDIVIIIALISFQVYLDLKLPDYMSAITRLVQSEGSNMNEILLNGGYMLLCAFMCCISEKNQETQTPDINHIKTADSFLSTVASHLNVITVSQ